MKDRTRLPFNRLLFIGCAGIVVLYIFSFSQVPRRIEERIELKEETEIGTHDDTTGTGPLLGWREEPCCPEKSSPPCDDPNSPPWVPDTDNPVMPYTNEVRVKIVRAYTASRNEFWLESPSPILLWEDPLGHEGEEQVIGPFDEDETLIFKIHSGICTSQVRYPKVSGEVPVWTMEFEDWKDCSWDDLIAEVSLELPVIKDTAISALDDVPLPGIEDPIYRGEFHEGDCDDFRQKKNEPFGDDIVSGVPKRLSFIMDCDFDACPEEPPWEPEYDITIRIGTKETRSIGPGWGAAIEVFCPYDTVLDSDLGNKDVDVEFEFSDPIGNPISDQDMDLTLKVFFEKWGLWHVQQPPPPFPVGVPNWYYYWRRISDFQSVVYKAYCSYYTNWPNRPGIIGVYMPGVDDHSYFVHANVGHLQNYPVYVTEPCCHEKEYIQGIDLFALSCRHETLHMDLFLLWWGSWAEYQILQWEQDPDQDLVPTDEEVWRLLDPYNKCSHPCSAPPCGGELGPMRDDFEYIVYSEQYAWNFHLWDDKDWANPGKQTYPPF